MRLASISSGSSGNCTYIGNDRYHILVDAGIPLKRIEEGLSMLGIRGSDIDAILITHEHSDHVSGLGPLLKKYNIPLYTSAGTAEALFRSSVKTLTEELCHYLRAGSAFSIGDVRILPLGVSHDAAEPLMYRFDSCGSSAAILTDTGIVTPEVENALQELDAILLESNHNERMLQVGPYPYFLKQRILGTKGHMSNEYAGDLLARLNCPRLKSVLLSHISRTNNYDELALESVRMELIMHGVAEPPDLFIAPEKELSKILSF